MEQFCEVREEQIRIIYHWMVRRAEREGGEGTYLIVQTSLVLQGLLHRTVDDCLS